MKTKTFAWIAVVAFSILFTAGSVSWGAEKVIKLGHVLDTKHPYHIASLHFSKRVAELTNGKIEVQVYPSSQLGNERELVEGMQVGTIEMGASTSAVAARFVKEIEIFNLPFLFSGFPHLYKVLDGQFGEELDKASQKKGLRVLGWWVGGSRSIYARKPISDLASMKGLKIRTMESPVVVATWKSLGLIPTPIPFGEVYTALQQGVVDAGEGNVISYESMKFDEVAPYLSHIKYLITVQLLLISENLFKSFSPEIQSALIKAGKECVAVERKANEESEEQIIQVLKKKNKSVVIPDLQPFVAAVQPVYEQYGKSIGADKIKWIQSQK
ncbi:MAG TPA: TRAP transporter substrate-binding protein [Thermodesulfobacteriota bacterium]|nr:TRAP transporter substrate-binding protein [Thermodesulfobacteriota bacterium]